jgi:hypothetical protein
VRNSRFYRIRQQFISDSAHLELRANRSTRACARNNKSRGAESEPGLASRENFDYQRDWTGKLGIIQFNTGGYRRLTRMARS